MLLIPRERATRLSRRFCKRDFVAGRSAKRHWLRVPQARLLQKSLALEKICHIFGKSCASLKAVWKIPTGMRFAVTFWPRCNRLGARIEMRQLRLRVREF